MLWGEIAKQIKEKKKSSPPPARGLKAIRNEGSWWEGCQLPPIHSAFLPFSKGSVTASPWVLRTWMAEVMLQRRMAPACRCPPLVTPTCWWCPVLCQHPPGRAEPGLAGWMEPFWSCQQKLGAHRLPGGQGCRHCVVPDSHLSILVRQGHSYVLK